jgi:hypothetical protein
MRARPAAAARATSGNTNNIVARNGRSAHTRRTWCAADSSFWRCHIRPLTPAGSRVRAAAVQSRAKKKARAQPALRSTSLLVSPPSWPVAVTILSGLPHRKFTLDLSRNFVRFVHHGGDVGQFLFAFRADCPCLLKLPSRPFGQTLLVPRLRIARDFRGRLVACDGFNLVL